MPLHPSITSTKSDTQNASSDVSFSQHLSFLLDSSPATVSALSASRNTRKLVIDSSIAALPQPTNQVIRRKPLSSSASPIVTRYSSGEYLTIARGLPRPEQRYSRSYSVDSPTVYEFLPSTIGPVANLDSTAKVAAPTKDAVASEGLGYPTEFELSLPFMKPDPAVIAGDLKHPSLADHNPAAPQTEPTSGQSQHNGQTSHDLPLAEAEADADLDPLSVLDGYDTDSSYNSNSNSNMSLHVVRKPAPPHLSLVPVDTNTRTTTITVNHDVTTPNTDKPLPKSPGSSKLSNFFGWGSPSPSTPEFSDKSFSPIPSPYALTTSNSYTDASPVTTVRPSSYLEAPKASYGTGSSRDYFDSYLATPSSITPSTSDQIEEMEDELKAISAELAASIRREMDLEDLVDRLQAERDNPTTTGNKRTSDYFSDSGYSSAKFSEYDQSREEIEKIQRRAEQDQAQVRLELTTKLQDERSKRQELDDQIKELSQRASQIDLAQMNSVDASGRVKELETTCETLRRKLSEERQVKDNFEDLLSALKGELQKAANERDNLRDEVVPQLRARVEGLEGQASELQKMTYESTKMQQELQVLKVENTSLKQTKSMNSIAEEPSPLPNTSRLSRSNSITGPPSSLRLQRPSSASLSRSKSVKTTESRDALSDRLKDVEEQRDALHKALKALLERQESQNRENEKKIRALEMERDRLATSSPQKAGFVREVSSLREEINVLRRRSEEALEQKWQVEKGLAGLKMDLDRAEQEIASLRSLLQEKDILIPESLARSSGSSDGQSAPATSESLTAAYASLQAAYATSLERVKNLELVSSPRDETTKLAIEKLEQALASAITEREFAHQEASSYKTRLDAVKADGQTYLESEMALADELRESARRVEELATQVSQQLATNQSLRQRLTDTVARGEAEHKSNAERITTMQARLRTLEEQVVAAQTASEERVVRHEEEISALKESHNEQLSRLGGGLRSPRLFPPKSPLSPMFAGAGGKSPRLSAMSVTDEAQVAALKERVAELERALADADAVMEEVVGRMNTAQIEVLELQEEREAAMSRTRKLERELQAEKVKAFEDRFKSLQA
ncbi:hypothetical protein BJ170DRAFT_583727 [Xylariales sp. AK1849]|nr:hypothetical protein BJ170DRAFT_583727 [Xylariales sp. AK1849]